MRLFSSQWEDLTDNKVGRAVLALAAALCDLVGCLHEHTLRIDPLDLVMEHFFGWLAMEILCSSN